MAELVVLLVICAGLCGRRGERWEWSRTRLADATHAMIDGTRRLTARARKALPGVASQCVEDVGDLVGDVLGIVDPEARARIGRRARAFLAERRGGIDRPARAGRFAASGPSPGAASDLAERASATYARLQRRYLEGAINLEEYVSEASRLRTPGPPSA